MDRVSDERVKCTNEIVSDKRLDWLIGGAELNAWKMAPMANLSLLNALTELRARREAERKAKEDKPEPYYAQWTDLTCPKCGHEAVTLDRFGYRCLIHDCGWTKDEGDGK